MLQIDALHALATPPPDGNVTWLVGQAVVWLDGHDVYPGAYGSEESKRRYDQLVSRLVAGEAQSIIEIERADEPKPVPNLSEHISNGLAYIIIDGRQI